VGARGATADPGRSEVHRPGRFQAGRPDPGCWVPRAHTLDFQLQASSVPRATFNHLASLEWIRAAENLCLVGPARTSKSHC
jgi:hypothetical protein